MNENILGTRKVSKLFIKFTIPAIISMVLSGSQTIIDGIFVGNYVGSNALASVNMVTPFMQIIFGISMVVGIGALSMIGRLLGANKREEARDTFKTATILLGGSLLVGAFIGIVFSRPIGLMLGANEALIDGVSTYLGTIAWFFPFIGLMFVFGFTDRLVGRPELYLWGSIGSLILNVVLDYTLIGVLGMGMMGAALATGFAYVLAFLIVMIPMLSKDNTVNLLVGRFNLKHIWPMVYNGSSEGVVSVAAALSAFIFNMAFIKFAGEDGVAAYTTINYLANFGILVMFGIADGIGPMISYNYGNERYDRVKETMHLAGKIIMVIGVILFATLMIGGRGLVELFAKGNMEVVNMAVEGSRLYAFSFLMVGFNIIYSSYYTAIGDAKTSIIIGASRGLIFILLGIAIWPVLFGINGVWLTIPVAEALTLGVVVYIKHRENTTQNLKMS